MTGSGHGTANRGENPAAPHARLPKALLPKWKAFANPAMEMSDEVTVPSSSVIIDGPHFDEMPIDQPLRGKTDEDVLPFTRDKYGKRIPESLHSPNGKFAEERRFNPDRPAGSKLLLVLRSILNSKTPPPKTPSSVSV